MCMMEDGEKRKKTNDRCAGSLVSAAGGGSGGSGK